MPSLVILRPNKIVFSIVLQFSSTCYVSLKLTIICLRKMQTFMIRCQFNWTLVYKIIWDNFVRSLVSSCKYSRAIWNNKLSWWFRSCSFENSWEETDSIDENHSEVANLGSDYIFTDNKNMNVLKNRHRKIPGQENILF